MNIVVSNEEVVGMRLDKFLVEAAGLSRSQLQGLIKRGKVKVNGAVVKTGYAVKISDEIYVPAVSEEYEAIEKEDIVLNVLIEKKDYMIVEKPFGMVVHPDDNIRSGTLVNAVLDKVDKGVGEEGRPGIVHRLDKDTSGVIIVARTDKGYEFFKDLFKSRKIEKFYLALVKGAFEHKEGVIDSPIARSGSDRKKMGLADADTGRNAVSIYRLMKEIKIDDGNNVSLVEIEIKTGRTHQIRVHMKAIGHPVVGDRAYGIGSYNNRFAERFGLSRQFLHAYRLVFIDPEGEKIDIKTKLPEDLEAVLSQIQ